MRKFLSLLALLLVLLTSAATLFAQDRPNLIELLENDGRFSTLLTAIDAAGLTDALQGDGPYTLLAPTDDAFAASLEAVGMTADDVLANPDTLAQILRYHVVPGRYTFRHLSRGATLGTALAGQRVTFSLTDGIFSANDAVISDIDNLASNGVMYALDSVLLPPAVAEALAAMQAPAAEPTAEPTPEPTVVAGVAAERPSLLALLQDDPDGQFSTLLAAIDVAGLSSTLSDGGPFTLLAPNNDAFAVAFDTLGMTADEVLADRGLVNQIVLYHILKGRHLYRNLTSGPTYDSLLLGQPVTFALTDGILTAGGGGSAVTDIDNLAANGVMDVVDSVLLPPAVLAMIPAEEPTPEPTAAPTEAATPEPTPEATPVAGVAAERPSLLALLQDDPDGRFSTLLAAIDVAGLSGTLSDSGPFTLLAPTDDAFAALLDQLGLTADDVLANRSLTNQVLLYHIINGRYLFRNLTSGPTLPTLLLGQSVTFSLADGVFAANGANISDIDNLAANGVMQVVDSVLLPPAVQAMIPTEEPTPEPTAAPTEAATPEPTPEATVVAGVAAERPSLLALLQNDPDGRFSTLLGLIDATGQTQTLSEGGPFTLLAPTDDAFAALLEQFGMTPDQVVANPALINPVLLYHVVPGRYLFRNLTGGATLPTLLTGQTVEFTLADGVFAVNGANISDIDNVASNGVMFAIDSVLVPPAIQAMLPTQEPTAEPTPEATPVAGVAAERPTLLALLQDDPDGRFSTLLAAVDVAGLSGTLTDGGPFTLLAPTDDAFVAALEPFGMTVDDMLADRSLTNQVVLYHIIRGRNQFRSLTSGPTLPTLLLGQSVTFSLADGVFTADGSNISDIDNLAANGVMHVVDTALLPPALRATLASNPRVRLAHFSSDAGAVDIYVNGALSSMTGVSFATVTDWVNVSPGTYEIGIAPAGGEPIATVSVTATENQWLTIVVNGSLSQGTLRMSAIPEDFSPLADGIARLSMFNAVEGSEPYNVTVDGEPVVIRLGYPGTLGNNDGYFSANVPAGEHVIQYVLTSKPSTVVLTLTNGTLEAGMSYLVAAAGSPGAPGVVVVPSTVPAP